MPVNVIVIKLIPSLLYLISNSHLQKNKKQAEITTKKKQSKKTPQKNKTSYP